MGSFNASLRTIGDTRGIPATVELRERRLAIKAGDSKIGDWPLDDVELEPTPTGYKLTAEGDQVLLDMSDSEQFTEELSSLSENGNKKKLGLFSRKQRNSEEEPKEELADTTAPVEPEEAPKAREAVSRIPASLIGQQAVSETSRIDEPVTPAPEVTEEDQDFEDKPSFSARLVVLLDRTIDASEKRWGPLLPTWVFNRFVFVTALLLIVLAFVFRGVTSVVLLVIGVLALMLGGVAYTDDVMASKLLPGRTTPTHVLVAGIGLLGVGIAFGLIA